MPTFRIATDPFRAQRLTAGVCVVHLVRNSLRYASKKHWSAITAGLRTVYTAATVAAAEARFAEQFPAVAELLRDAKADVTAFADFPLAHWHKIWSTALRASTRGSVRRCAGAGTSRPSRPR